MQKHSDFMIRYSVELELALEGRIEGVRFPGTLVARGYASEIMSEEPYSILNQSNEPTSSSQYIEDRATGGLGGGSVSPSI